MKKKIAQIVLRFLLFVICLLRNGKNSCQVKSFKEVLRLVQNGDYTLLKVGEENGKPIYKLVKVQK